MVRAVYNNALDCAEILRYLQAFSKRSIFSGLWQTHGLIVKQLALGSAAF